MIPRNTIAHTDHLGAPSARMRALQAHTQACMARMGTGNTDTTLQKCMKVLKLGQR